MNRSQITSSALFFGILLLLTIVIDARLTSAVRGADHDDFRLWSGVVNGEASADVVVYGSSRAMVHFDCEAITENTGKTCRNLGLNATGILLQEPLMQLYNKYNEETDVTIISVDIQTLNKRDKADEIFNPDQYLPYLSEQELASRIVDLDSDYFKERYIPLYDFAVHKDNFDIALTELQNNPPPWNIRRDEFGYAERDKEWDGKFDNFKENNSLGMRGNIDISKIEVLNAMIKEAKTNSKRVVILYPPIYEEFFAYRADAQEISDLYAQMAADNSVEYYDFSRVDFNDNQGYFYNSQHLNKDGVGLFTRLLANKVL